MVKYAEVPRIEATVKNEMVVNRQESNPSAKNTREELSGSFKQFSELISGVMNDTKSVEAFNSAQKDNFFAFLGKQSEQNAVTSQKLDKMRDTLEKKIAEMQMVTNEACL